ncbi:MAG: type IV secretion system protein [Acidobacteriota bacterium]
MEQNPFTFLGQATTQLLATHSPAIQAMGLDIFRGLAVILIVWFGVQTALSTAQGFYGSFHFGQFANLLLAISFGLGMLTYYSQPLPGIGYSFSDLITQETLQLSGQIESDQTQQIADAVVQAQEQLGSPPGIFSFHETLTIFVMAVALAAIEAVAFAVIAYGYVASAVCVLVGPIFIPFFIVPKLDFLFWGWFKAFLGYSFYQVIASAFIFVFSKVLLGLLGVIGPISLSNAFTLLPAVIVILAVCAYGLLKIPELTSAILSGRTGNWVSPLGNQS